MIQLEWTKKTSLSHVLFLIRNSTSSPLSSPHFLSYSILPSRLISPERPSSLSSLSRIICSHIVFPHLSSSTNSIFKLLTFLDHERPKYAERNSFPIHVKLVSLKDLQDLPHISGCNYDDLWDEGIRKAEGKEGRKN